MKLVNMAFEVLVAVLFLQWAAMLALFGYAKWGFWGGAAAFISSPALIPFSPLVAWSFDDSSQVLWFYGLLVAALVFGGFNLMLKRRAAA